MAREALTLEWLKSVSTTLTHEHQVFVFASFQ